MWTPWNPHILLVGVEIGTTPVENHLAGSVERSICLPCDSAILYVPMLTSTKAIRWQAHGSTIHSGLKLETIQMSINRRPGK